MKIQNNTISYEVNSRIRSSEYIDEETSKKLQEMQRMYEWRGGSWCAGKWADTIPYLQEITGLGIGIYPIAETSENRKEFVFYQGIIKEPGWGNKFYRTKGNLYYLDVVKQIVLKVIELIEE